MTTCKEESKSAAWVDTLYQLTITSEEAESRLSYLSTCKTEEARKESGSYYTPTDVASFFWKEFFKLHRICDESSSLDYLKSHRFVEPAAGAGSLIFAMFHQFALVGVQPRALADIDLSIVDVNDRALAFIQEQLDSLSTLWKIQFKNIRLICEDFRKIEVDYSDRPLVIFGNPPFVANQKGKSEWKNLFADFVDLSLCHVEKNGTLHFILPLSISFSRDFCRLRKIMRSQMRNIVLSHYDNIPDTLFKSGKPHHINTNKANSQRCSIVTVYPSRSPRVFSTKLHRWSKRSRRTFFSQSPLYYDVTEYQFNDQFPRPENQYILNYLSQNDTYLRFGDLINYEGKKELLVASVARNFIGIRETSSHANHHLKFVNEKDFYLALLLLTSDVFYSYWRTVGDGFHVTKANINDFPISRKLFNALSKNIQLAQRIWKNRMSIRKSKQNAGRLTYSYDFSGQTPAFLPHIYSSIIKG